MVSTFSGRWIGTNQLTFAHPRIVVSARGGSGVTVIEDALRHAGAFVEVVDAQVTATGVIELEPDLVVVDVESSGRPTPSAPADRPAGSGLIRTIHEAYDRSSFVPI